MIKIGQETICRISKAGRNLFAMIPIKEQENFGRGDKVKITLVEKAPIINKENIKTELEEFIKSPNGSKLKGNIMGYQVEIPIVKFLRNLPNKEAKRILMDSLIGK